MQQPSPLREKILVAVLLLLIGLFWYVIDQGWLNVATTKFIYRDF